jgi:hypothetical protein
VMGVLDRTPALCVRVSIGIGSNEENNHKDPNHQSSHFDSSKQSSYFRFFLVIVLLAKPSLLSVKHPQWSG